MSLSFEAWRNQAHRNLSGLSSMVRQGAHYSVYGAAAALAMAA